MKGLYVLTLLVVTGAVLSIEAPTATLARGHQHCIGAIHAQAAMAAQRIPPKGPQQPWSPHPGNPGHKEPPKQFYCDNKASLKAGDPKQCGCHRECIPDGNGGLVTIEDNVLCSSACFADHCTCEGKNCP